jgi:hypothetical protein
VRPAACLGQLDPSLFLWSTARWGPWGTRQHRSSPLGEAGPGPHDSVEAHLGREARSGPEEHVAAPELSSRRGRARSHRIRGSVGAYLDREARSRAEERVMAPELNSVRRRGPRPRGSTGAHLSKEVRSGTAEHVTTPKPISAERCDPKLQLTWQHMNVRTTPYFNLELVYRDTRSSGCRQTHSLCTTERINISKTIQQNPRVMTRQINFLKGNNAQLKQEKSITHTKMIAVLTTN